MYNITSLHILLVYDNVGLIVILYQNYNSLIIYVLLNSNIFHFNLNASALREGSATIV